MSVYVCPKCLGKYGGPYTHSHSSAAVFDPRFEHCRLCQGHGAITCEKCLGTGRVDENGQPAIEAVTRIEVDRLKGMEQSPRGMTPARPEKSDIQNLKESIRIGLEQHFRK